MKRQAEAESRAPTLFAFYPDITAMGFYDMFGDSQAHAGAFSGPGFISLIKTLKDAR
jgi:hypothetical protein